MFLYYTILFLLANIVLSQNPSPCPDTFTYEKGHNERDRWYGVISLKTSEDLNGVWLDIILDRKVDLLGNWFGDASSSDNTEFTIRNKKYKLEAGPPVTVRFFVKYNSARTIPSIATIRLNGKTICSTKKSEIELRPTVPTLHISQSTSSKADSSSNNQATRPSGPSNASGNQPSNVNKPGGSVRKSPMTGPASLTSSGSSLSMANKNEQDDGPEFYRGDFAPSQDNTWDRPTKKPFQIGTRSTSCGVVASKANPLISHGQSTTPGQWPWHAALYHSDGIHLVYTCGGTLISEQHILTAAHCVTKPKTTNPVDANKLLIYLGKYDLIGFGSEIQDRPVSKIFVHPEYNESVFFNDIAVVKLSKPIEITNFVRPCCLWEDDNNLESVIGKEGIVVGWGFDENKVLSKQLMQASMPVVSPLTCIYSKRDFFSQFTFDKNYCAGFRNGTSVCNGDSGGGMVFPKKGTSGSNTVWQIRGVVSIGVAFQNQGICDTSHYIVLTDAAKHTDWIQEVLAN